MKRGHKRRKFERVLKKALLKKWFMYAIILGLILMLVFFFTPLVFILIFMAVNGLIGLLLRPLIVVGLGVEVGVFATIVASCVFGPKVGIIGGILVLLTKLIFQTVFSPRALIIIVSHIIMGGLAFYFYDGVAMNITAVGIGFTIFHVIFTSLLSFFFLGANIGKIGFFVLTNIPWNIFLFTYLGPTLVHYLS